MMTETYFQTIAQVINVGSYLSFMAALKGLGADCRLTSLWCDFQRHLRKHNAVTENLAIALLIHEFG